MAKILKFPGGENYQSRKDRVVPAGPESRLESNLAALTGFYTREEASGAIFRINWQKLLEAQTFLSKLGQSYTPRAARNQELYDFQSFSDEELVIQFNNSSSNDWSERPDYWAGIYNEIYLRNLNDSRK